MPMNSLTELERWIAIMSVMKTSESIKKMDKNNVDYLLINLRREFAPNLDDDQIEFVNKEINYVADDVKKACVKFTTKMLGEGDKKEAIKQLTGLVGKDKASIITKLFGKNN
jgi:hypothetical protein